MWADLLVGCRSLRRSPIFAATAIATLAIGIGSSSAIFSIVHAVLPRALPFRDPDQLVRIWEAKPADGNERALISAANFNDWRSRSRTQPAAGSRHRPSWGTGSPRSTRSESSENRSPPSGRDHCPCNDRRSGRLGVRRLDAARVGSARQRHRAALGGRPRKFDDTRVLCSPRHSFASGQ